MLNIHIGETATQKTARVEKYPGIKGGLVTYTTPLQVQNNSVLFALNDDYGRSMNVNAASTGTPDDVYLENTEWTTSALSGTWTFNSATQAQNGSVSIDASATVNNDTALLTRSSALDFSNYSALTISFYVTSYSGSGTKDITLGFRNAGVVVGNTVNVGDYNDFSVLNSWFTVVIPLSDFGIAASSSIDEMTITTVDIGGGQPPNYFIDDIKILETGEPIIFKMEPEEGTIKYVYNFEFVIVDNISGVVADGTVPGFAYDKFGGLNSLANGILLRRYRRDEVVARFVVQNHGDIAALPGSQFVGAFSDGTNTLMKIALAFPAPIILDSAYHDRIEVVLSDDLSGLLDLKISSVAAEVIDPQTF